MLASSFESPEALKIFLSRSSLEQFKTTLAQLSFSELAESLVFLQTESIMEAENKLNALFQFIDSSTTLETIGHHCSMPAFLSFLDFLGKHPSYQNRLPFLLVGLDPVVFSQALALLQSHHLVLLKLESLFEPLQYHLTQFIHEGESLRQEIEHKTRKFQQDLPFIKPEELTPNSLKDLTRHIDRLRDQLLDYLERLSMALAIAWHTNRLDLIEKLSSINETLQHQLFHTIGHSSLDTRASTALYSTLEHSLAQLFDSSLKNDDAAVEGLTRLSIWYLKDYWELGLLPSIHNLKELDPQHETEEERLSHQQRLFFLVQQQLERLKIGTVGDLKKAHLFSKSLLQIYIEQHQHLLRE